MDVLDHVLWIGGPAGVGKTTVATLLARRHGLRWYGADTRTWEHRDRALREGVAAAHRWEALTPEARWEAPPPELLEMGLHAERGRMVCDDLAALPRSPLVVAEGTVLPPWAVSERLADRAHAVWLLPTRELHRRRLAGRPAGPVGLALHMAEVVEREAREHGVPTLVVDGSLGIPETVAAVEELFAAALDAGPRARTARERRELLREANVAIVRQVRGYFARPWAEGEADAAEREFLCECGDPACTEVVRLPVGAVAVAAALAPGHEPHTG